MDAAAAPKRQRLDEGAGAGEVDLSALEASGGADALEVLDLRAAKRLLLGFERRLRDNLEARMKHPDDPARFADSEIALHSETDRLRLLAGAPDLFPDLASSLSSLLTHDNADLAAASPESTPGRRLRRIPRRPHSLSLYDCIRSGCAAFHRSPPPRFSSAPLLAPCSPRRRPTGSRQIQASRSPSPRPSLSPKQRCHCCWRGHALFGECGARLQRRPVETGSR